MIEFSGQLSQEGIDYIRQQTKQGWVRKRLLKGDLICLLLFTLPVVILGIWISPWIFLIELGVAPLCIALCRNVNSCIYEPPVKIAVDDLYVEVFLAKSDFAVKTQDVEQVIDMGNFYYIEVGETVLNRQFVCEKQLLSKGTLEEFEKLFEGKLVRQNNHDAEKNK